MLEIEIQDGNPNITQYPIDTLYAQSNLSFQTRNVIDDGFGDLILSKLSSRWHRMEELTNIVFNFSNSIELNWAGVYPDVLEIFTPKLYSVKLKIMHDFYFDQIGTSEEQINTLDVHTYSLYIKDGANHLNTVGPWSSGISGYFDAYIPGPITLGNETVSTTHPLVHHVDGNEIVINAQSVLINGPVQVEPGYKLIVQALEQIHSVPGTSFNPQMHLRIKQDFYDTPMFEYSDNHKITSFCNSSAYLASDPSRALRERIEQELAEAFHKEVYTPKANNTSLSLYPNPARSELTIQSQGSDIDRLTIFDTATRPAMQASPGGQNMVRMDISKLAQGVYIVRAECGDEVLTEKLVVAR